MKNYPGYILSIALVIALGFGLSSCKEDEPTRPKLSFAEPTMSVSESDGVIEAELVLDKPYGKDLTVEYTLGGTASDQDAVGTANADYEVAGTHGVAVIESGQTSGVIKFQIYNDAMFEPDETIEISILDINTGDVELTADDETVITITNDDVQLTASFPVTTMTVNEDDGTDGLTQVAVQLDKVAPIDITVQYEIKIDLNDPQRNDAIDSLFASQYTPQPIPSPYYDYYIHGTKGQVVIPAGSSTGNIEIQIYTDFMFEDDETIEITLTGSSAAQIGTSKTMIITLKQQNGKVIALVWDDAHTNVDMDMFLWVGEDTTNLTGILASAITAATTPRQELIFVPALLMDGALGLSYTYYSGTADPMNFEVHFADFDGVAVEDVATRDIFAASYTLANINPWDQESGTFPPVIAQRFVIGTGVYSYGSIKVPASASRMKKQTPPTHLRKHLRLPSERLFSF